MGLHWSIIPSCFILACKSNGSPLTCLIPKHGGREEISGDGKYAIKFQDDYLQELISETNYPSFDVDGACEPFYHWKKHRSLNIMKFRDNAYKRVVTGSMALAHHTA